MPCKLSKEMDSDKFIGTETTLYMCCIFIKGKKILTH